MRTDPAVASPLLEVLRGLTAAGVITSAAVHLDLYVAGFSDIAVIGPLFLANALAGFMLGTAVLIWRHWAPAVLCAGFGAGTAVAYWWSVLFGLFGVREVTGGWSVILAEIAEYLAVGCGLAMTGILLTHRRAPRRPSPTTTPTRATVGVP
jgi:hypothetical protein